MRKLEQYITVGTKRLRCGYTTGTCAAAAARAAADLLLEGSVPAAVAVETPSGATVVVDVEEHDDGPGWARCAVRKDAGDDPDVTDGVLVHARVERVAQPGVHIDGGAGVGRVTRPGLDQPVGAAAINSTPRRMIREQVEQALALAQSAAPAALTVDSGTNADGGDSPAADSAADPALPGLLVTISIPEGVALAARTFNPRLGVEGGISVIGTSGIVRPMSDDALVSTIQLQLRMLRARGERDVLVVPGNYGRDFACGTLKLDLGQAVTCSNFFGVAIDAACMQGFDRMLIVGHIGKMAKVAAGVMNTHSRVADCRVEALAAHAACAGASRGCVQQVMAAATTDAALDALRAEGVAEGTMESLLQSLAEKLAHRAAGRMQVEAIVFSNVHGMLGATPGAHALAMRWREGSEGKGSSSQDVPN